MVSQGVCVCVFVAAHARKCEEQFQMVTKRDRDRGKKGKTSQKGSRAARTEMEAQRAGNANLILVHTHTDMHTDPRLHP